MEDRIEQMYHHDKGICIGSDMKDKPNSLINQWDPDTLEVIS